MSTETYKNFVLNIPGSVSPPPWGNIENALFKAMIDHMSIDENDYLRVPKVWHAYGGFQNKAEVITLPAKDTWVKITNVAGDLWTGLEADGLTLANDVMTVVNAGDYAGSLSLTFSALNGKDYQIRVYNNTQASQMGYIIGASTTGVNNFTNITLPLYIEADAGDELQMEIQSTTDGTNPILKSSVFYLSYLHE